MGENDEIGVNVRLTLLEERLREGFISTNEKLDTFDEKLNSIIRGETTNCTIHQLRLEEQNRKIKDLEENKATADSVKTLYKICLFVCSILAAAVINHIWF